MIMKDTLRTIVMSQREELSALETGIGREDAEKADLNAPFATIITGVRRCGKSTLLRQLMGKARTRYYFNFEDPRATNFGVADFPKLDEIFAEEYGKGGCYFFDEIQNVPKWEVFIRRLIDGKRHAIITGSNASLLSRELGTRLTGRHLNVELFPFSFGEFLELKGRAPGAEAFRDYLSNGGFPEYLKTGRTDVLQELLNDIIMRDIAVRYGIRNTRVLKELAVYLLTNVGKEFTYNSLKKTFRLGSINSVISFISHFEDAYLLFTVPRFDYSFRKRVNSPKKIYAVDNGLAGKNSASFSEDKGRLLENAVFTRLRRSGGEVFYFRGEGECDFVVKEGSRITGAIQVCHDLNEENMERETGGLLEAMKKFGLKEGLLLTDSREDELKEGGLRIKVRPAWKWMLENAKK